MKTCLCLSCFVLIIMFLGQQAEGSECDRKFVQAIMSAKQRCFNGDEDLKDFLTTVLLGQPNLTESLAEEGEHFRTESSAGEIRIPEEWKSQNHMKEEKHDLKPEKLEELEKKMGCLQESVKHNGMFKEMQTTCNQQGTGGGHNIEDKHKLSQARMACMMHEVSKKCPKLVPSLLGVEGGGHDIE